VEPGKSESSDLGGLTTVTAIKAKTLLKDSDDQMVVLRRLAINERLHTDPYRLGRLREK
jgi:hypothetical protein